MKDRVSLYPGRVLISPEDGSTPYHATLTRADEPTQEGTPLNKANLLTDATEISIWGSANNRTINEALSKLQAQISTAQSTANSKARIQTGSYVGTGTKGASNPCILTFDALPYYVGIVSAVDKYTTSATCRSWGRDASSSASSSSANGILTELLSESYPETANGWYYTANSSTFMKKSGTTISWYSETSADGQFNSSGFTYQWIAIFC